MTTSNINPEMLQNSRVEGSDGQNIGKVGQVYADNQTGQPSWVAVKTGWFGTSESFVPLDAASIDGDIVRVPYDKDMIKGAPNYEVDVPLSEDRRAGAVRVLRSGLSPVVCRHGRNKRCDGREITVESGTPNTVPVSDT